MAKTKINSPSCARSLAIFTLLELNNLTSLQSCLDQSFAKFSLAPIETKLCTELVYGYVRYEIRINYVLDTMLKRRHKIPLPLQFALGVATYSLLFLDRIPHHATVNWTVNFAKINFGLSLSKVCNGVLRSIIRLKEDPHSIDFYAQKSFYYSLPVWIYDLWVNSYGEYKTKILCEKSLNRPFQSIRLNKLHANYANLKNAISSLESAIAIGFDGYVFTSEKLPNQLLDKNLQQLHDEGCFSWQSVGSQDVLKKCFDAVPELFSNKFWDACAGQGGKTFALLEQGVNVVMSSDTSKSRLIQYMNTAKRLNLPSTNIAIMSALHPSLNLLGCSVLLDVPCSGFGTLSKRPDIRRNRSTTATHELTVLQAQMLHACFAKLDVGQYIIYLTCTLNPSENEDQIKNFLDLHSNAKLFFSYETDFEINYIEGMYAAVLQKV